MRNKRKILILGSGIAGLSTALKLVPNKPLDGSGLASGPSSDFEITLVAKKNLSEGSTVYAQGGIASVWDKDDSFAKHQADTEQAGDGLCHPDIVSLCVSEGPARIRDLVEWGVNFTRQSNKETATDYDLHREGGHQERRILHKDDLTGAEIERALIKAVKSHPQIKILENATAIDLILDPTTGSCVGAYILDTKTNHIKAYPAHSVVLATGGAGKAYLYSTNPATSTGDGIAMAARAGARVANLEFMQFHPTCLFHPLERSFLITEALRGDGAVLKNLKLHPFMKDAHPMKDLAPRDIVARAIDKEMKRTGAAHVWLDATHLGKTHLQSHYPNIYTLLLKLGIQMERDLIPIVPAAHYTCGGVLTDDKGLTTISGLYAVGEVACTGLHGANRLASNSLLEGVVFGSRAATHILELLSDSKRNLRTPESLPEWEFGQAVEIEDQIDIAATWYEIRWIMWNYVGIVRSNHRLIRAAKRLETISNEVKHYYWKYKLTPELIELRNLILVSEKIVECAMNRRESRGLHWNVDYPMRDDQHYKRDTIV